MQLENPYPLNTGAAGSGVSQKGWLRRLLTGQKTTTDVIRVDPGINDTLVQEAAAATEGFSGRELAKMVASMQVHALCSPSMRGCEKKTHLCIVHLFAHIRPRDWTFHILQLRLGGIPAPN